MDVVQYAVLSVLLLVSAAWLLDEFWRNLGEDLVARDDRLVARFTDDYRIPEWLRAVPPGEGEATSATRRGSQETRATIDEPHCAGVRTDEHKLRVSSRSAPESPVEQLLPTRAPPQNVPQAGSGGIDRLRRCGQRDERPRFRRTETSASSPLP